MQSRTAAGSRTIDLESLCRLVIAINHLRTLASTLSDCFFGQRLYFRSGAGLDRASSRRLSPLLLPSSHHLPHFACSSSRPALCVHETKRITSSIIFHSFTSLCPLAAAPRTDDRHGRGGAGARSSSLDGARSTHWCTRRESRASRA